MKMDVNANIPKIKLTPDYIPDSQILEIAEDYLLKDKIIIYPTDTLYGLGGNPLNEEVIQSVFSIKQRDTEKGLPILSNSLEKIREICQLNDIALRLAKEFWPGPLTMVLPKKPIIRASLTGSKDTVAVRIPDHEFCLRIMAASNGFLIGTSANLSSEPNPTRIEDISPSVLNRVDLIIDMGKSKHGKPSTIVDVSTGSLKILREGSLDLSDWVD